MPPHRCQVGRWFCLMGLVGLLLVSCGSTPSVDLPETSQPMQLHSSAFEAGQAIPTPFTCDGDDLSPPLSWDAPPEGTQSLALIVDDPDAPGRTFVHWVAYNLPPDVRALSEAMPIGDMLPGGGTQGTNDFDKRGFGGPCPPSGTHRYFFKLYALDTALDLPAGAKKGDVITAMEGHILGHGELMGTYSR